MKKKSMFIVLIVLVLIAVVCTITYFCFKNINGFDNSKNLKETDSAYFKISQDGTISLDEDYRGGGIYNNELPQEIIIPEKINGITVKRLSDGMFSGCSSVKVISIPKTLTMNEIPKSCFSGCSNLEKIIIPDNIANSISTVSSFAFCNCEKLEEINLPNVMCVEEWAFHGCTTIKKITISDNLGEAAIQNMDNLEELTIVCTSTDKIYELFYNMYSDSHKSSSQFVFSGTKNIKRISLKNISMYNVPLSDVLTNVWWISCVNNFNNDNCMEVGLEKEIYDTLESYQLQVDGSCLNIVPIND